ncbi:hypothetical protein [Limnochorda pilosa]|uniref:Uncharacterized protein n=1 Tax=Limnochorda pilosa TaxID=1555112 RepID=A0A0K2SKV7_LIMPI|nr:hypothetical protein [Limnochorda pilosa]BAS27743.1 hypothetical protein LIP_1902 [Limnochorda pilosa]
MSRLVRWAVLLGGFIVLVVAPWVLSIPRAGAAPRVLDRDEVRVTVHIPPLAAVHVIRGSALSFAYDGSSPTVQLSDALALEVMANAPWEAQVQAAGPFAIHLAPASAVGSRTSGPAPASAAITGGAGRHAYRWDVRVSVPEGTPAGLYQIPVSVLVGLNVP